MSKYRRITQLIFLAFFGFLLVQAFYPYERLIPSDLFIRFDPLAVGTAALADRVYLKWLWMGAGTLAITALLGRVFCGWVCPMGTTIDLAEMALFKKRKIKEQKKELQWLKYGALSAVIISALVGINLDYWLDPIPLVNRIYTLVFYPAVMGAADLFLRAAGPMFEKLGVLSLAYLDIKPPVYREVFLTLGIFAAIIGLSSLSPRFFCRNLCPLGALLGVCSRYSVLAKHVSPECTNCKACERSCPTGAIEKDTWKDHEAECIKCFVCQDACPVEAISYNFKGKPLRDPRVDLGKRRFIGAGLLGLGAGVLGRQSGDLRNRPDKLVRPPGALPENDFLANCTRCGECMRVCPTRVIQPEGFEQGLAGAFAAKMDMRLAGCDQQCKVCGDICPTNALRKLTLEEKKYAKLGTAAIDQSRCLVYAWGKTCQICDEACPYNAIIFKTVDGKRVPVIVPSRCNGCGWCETLCPVIGESAIRVSPAGELRLPKGSYKKEALERGIDLSAKDEVDNQEETPENKLE